MREEGEAKEVVERGVVERGRWDRGEKEEVEGRSRGRRIDEIDRVAVERIAGIDLLKGVLQRTSIL